MQEFRVPTDDEMNAIGTYDPAFRFTFSYDDLSEYYKGFVNWHKQPTVEISVVREGAVDVYVLQQKKTVVAGEGFCILPGCLHSICVAPGYDVAKYFTLIFHPAVLYGYPGSYYDHAYYRPFTDAGVSLYHFCAREPWTEEVFASLQWIATHCTERWGDAPVVASPPDVRLQIQHRLQDIWAQFAGHLSTEAGTPSPAQTRKIHDLIAYLHAHYAEKFSLTALAQSVFMSRNECCRYFKQAMGMTISAYLLEYRLSRAAELLETSGLSVTEIAAKAGFCDVSYFIQMFRRKTGVTPKVYARRRGAVRASGQKCL